MAEDKDKLGSQGREKLNVLWNTISVTDIEQEWIIINEELT